MRRTAVAALLGVLVAVSALAGPAWGERLLDTTEVVAWESHDAYPVNGGAGDTLRLVLAANGSVDLLLMTPEGYAAYLSAGDASGRYASGSALGATSADVSLALPGSGTYYVVVDNSAVPEAGGAAGVAVGYTLTVDRDPASILTALCAGGVVLLVLLGLGYLLWSSRRARRAPSGVATVGERPPLVVCESCGGMTGGTDKCTICGEPLQAG